MENIKKVEIKKDSEVLEEVEIDITETKDVTTRYNLNRIDIEIKYLEDSIANFQEQLEAKQQIRSEIEGKVKDAKKIK